MPRLTLLPIHADGTIADFAGEVTPHLEAVLAATRNLYAEAGFQKPWIGYVGVATADPVGICSFKAAPINNRVEIAYHTFPEYEGRGHATAMAAKLVAIARREEPGVVITAQTLVEPNASHRILRRLGFEPAGRVDHPEDGTVLEWRLPAAGRGL